MLQELGKNIIYFQGIVNNNPSTIKTEIGKSFVHFVMHGQQLKKQDFSQDTQELELQRIQRIIGYDGLAKILQSKKIKKGDLLKVSGHFLYRSYDRDGETKRVRELLVGGVGSDFIVVKRSDRKQVEA